MDAIPLFPQGECNECLNLKWNAFLVPPLVSMGFVEELESREFLRVGLHGGNHILRKFFLLPSSFHSLSTTLVLSSLSLCLTMWTSFSFLLINKFTLLPNHEDTSQKLTVKKLQTAKEESADNRSTMTLTLCLQNFENHLLFKLLKCLDFARWLSLKVFKYHQYSGESAV